MTPRRALVKVPTGIAGLDEITGGGLPKGRTTLVCGSAGCGKSLLAAEFLIRGALDQGDTGVLLSFEESLERIAENVAALGWDMMQFTERGLVVVDELHMDDTLDGPDLDGLFLRLAVAIQSVGASRVVIDGIDTLMAGSASRAARRADIRRLFDWLSAQGVTAVVTAGRGSDRLTETGLEEYVADCVILLDARLVDQALTRRMRIVKYRGSFHGPNEYPFLIDETGIEVLPASTARLNYPALDERVSIGTPELDEMFGGGVFRATSVLFTGPAGSAKSTFSALMAQAACARGERALIFAFEESPAAIVRNMRSVGIDLGRWLDAGLLRIVSTRPTQYGLEGHLAIMRREVAEFEPHHVSLDPVTALGGEAYLTEQMLARVMDFLREREITVLVTGLIPVAAPSTEIGISSIVDTWVLLTNESIRGHRVRGISIRKSRGTAHSDELLAFTLSDDGLHLGPPCGAMDAVDRTEPGAD